MTRRKGEVTARMNELKCPYVVEVAIPVDGLGLVLVEAMYRFHRVCGIATQRGRRQRRGEQEFVRFCFADSATADAFQARFGGEHVSRKQ